MGKYEDITEARKILGIEEIEKLKVIKDKFKTLIKKYHPDVCKESPEVCRKKAEELINAYKTLMEYCDNYKFSFSKDEVTKYLTTDEFWKYRFGNDPLWSNSFDSKKDL